MLVLRLCKRASAAARFHPDLTGEDGVARTGNEARSWAGKDQAAAGARLVASSAAGRVQGSSRSTELATASDGRNALGEGERRRLRTGRCGAVGIRRLLADPCRSVRLTRPLRAGWGQIPPGDSPCPSRRCDPAKRTATSNAGRTPEGPGRGEAFAGAGQSPRGR